MAGSRRSARRAPAAEFVEHRAYSPGDDPRRIDWHVYARLGTPVVRLGELPAGVTARLIVDNSRSMDWGDPNKLHRAGQIAAGIGYVALCQLDRVAVEPLAWTMDDGTMPPHPPLSPGERGDLTPPPPLRRGEGEGRPHPRVSPFPFRGGGWGERSIVLTGKAQAFRLFAAIGRLEAADSGRPEMAEATVERRLAERASLYRPGDLICLISDFLVPGGYRDAIRAWQARGLDVRVVHVLAPQELRPEASGDCDLIDAESGERRELTLAAGTLDRYQRRLTEWLGEVEGFCADRKIPYARVNSATPIDRVMLSDLRRAGVLA